jgi:hypothetical protein
MKMYERIIRVPNNLFKDYKVAESRLKSKVSFVNKVKNIYQAYNVEFPTKVRRFTNSKESRSYDRKFTKSKSKITSRVIKERDKYHLEESNNKIWKDLRPMQDDKRPRKTFVANFRKQTGHDVLQAHLFKLKIKPSPLCELCKNSNQTAEHLFECSALKNIKEDAVKTTRDEQEIFAALYWHVRNLNR